MLKGLFNFDGGMRSYYDLSRVEANKLEREFKSNDMGREVVDAMHVCVGIGIFTFVVSIISIMFMMASGFINIYNFMILFLLLILGIAIVVGSTIEYQIKYNSWLRVSKRIIKK